MKNLKNNQLITLVITAVTVFGTISSDGSMEINTISLGEKMGMNPRLGR